MRALLLLIVVALSACKAPVREGPETDTGGLSERDFARLAAINDAQENALSAARGRGPCAISARGESGLGRGNWLVRRGTPSAAAGCPVQFQEQWAYDHGKRTLNYNQELWMPSGDLARTAGLGARRANGVIRTEGPSGFERNVGVIHFERMHVNNVGRVDADLTVNHAPGGRSDIEIHVRDGGRGFVGRITRDAHQAETLMYYVNGQRITEAGFRRLFSSYGAGEIMANLDKLR